MFKELTVLFPEMPAIPEGVSDPICKQVVERYVCFDCPIQQSVSNVLGLSIALELLVSGRSMCMSSALAECTVLDVLSMTLGCVFFGTLPGGGETVIMLGGYFGGGGIAPHALLLTTTVGTSEEEALLLTTVTCSLCVSGPFSPRLSMITARS